MNEINLNQIWENVNYDGNGEVSYRLMSLKSIPSLNLGLNRHGQRCLVLELPTNIQYDVKENQKENISLIYYQTEKCISITLNDSFFEDLFNDLILSIYFKIYQIEDPYIYANHFVAYYFKWLSFLDNRNKQLSKEIIKGVWGEVKYLKSLLIAENNNVNDILASWQGPYNNKHDFIFEMLDVEIKTIDDSKNEIKISSEYQLENEPSKNLELTVLIVRDDTKEGETLEKLATEVRQLILELGGDINLFSDALFQKGLTFGNLEQYNLYGFKLLKSQTFDCCAELFPRLIKSQLPEEITKVSYAIKLNMIQNFLLFESEL